MRWRFLEAATLVDVTPAFFHSKESRMSKVLMLLCTAAFTVWQGAAAGDAAKLNVLCGSSMSEPVKKVADAFQRDTEVQVELTLGGCEVL